MATAFLGVKNRATATLAEDIDNSETAWDINAGDTLPTAYPFDLTADNEIVRVTGRAADTLTVTRNVQGTSAATHTNGATLSLRITAQSISDLNAAVNTIEDNFADLRGRAGGQTLKGGTAASEILILKGTAHATRGGVRADDQFEALPVSPINNPPYALVVDEATTNLVANPSFEVNHTDGWTAVLTPTLTRDTTQKYSGDASMKIITDAVNEGVESNTMPAAVNEQWVGSVWVKGNTGGEKITLHLIQDVGDNSTQQFTLPTLGTGEANQWRRYMIPRILSVSPTTIKLRITLDVAGTVFIDGVQLELKTATGGMSSYCDGSLGLGYTWSGTAHNSASSRTAGLHSLAPYKALASQGFGIRPDGAFSGSHWQFVGEEGSLPAQMNGHNQIHFDFIGAHESYVSGWTPILNRGPEAVVRVYNERNGVCLMVDGRKVTTEFAFLVACDGLTSGVGMGIGAPADLTLFTGEYFQFYAKGGGPSHWKWSKLRFKCGENVDVLGKYVEGYGGGKYPGAAGTTLAGTITCPQTTTVTGSGTAFLTDFDIGDTIWLNSTSYIYRVTAIASNTSLTIHTASQENLSAAPYGRRTNTQYKPFGVAFESAGGDHLMGHSDFQNFMWFNRSDRPRFLRSSAVSTLTLPTVDTDGLAFVTQAVANSTSQQVADAATDESLFSFTLPYQRLNVGDALRITLNGTMSVPTANRTLTLKVKIGSATVLTTHAETIAFSATAYRWRMEILVAATSNDDQKVTMDFLAKLISDGGNQEVILDQETQTNAVDTDQADRTVDVTAVWDATTNAPNITKELAMAEVI